MNLRRACYQITALALFAVLTACSTTSHEPDKAPTQHALPSAVKTFVLADKNATLVRMDPRAWPRLYPFVETLLSGGHRRPEPSRKSAAAKTRIPSLREFAHDKVHADIPSALDLSRPIWVSVETGFDVEAQACFDLAGLCPPSYYSSPRFGRALVPAKDADTLAKQLRKALPHRSHLGGDFAAMLIPHGYIAHRIVPQGDYVRVEFSIGEADAATLARLDERAASRPLPAKRRMTPALERFIHQRTALAIYAKTSAMTKFGPAHRVGDILLAVPTASFANKLSIMLSGVRYALHNPAATPDKVEFEDAAFLLDGDAHGGLLADVFATPTARGRKVLDLSGPDLQLPSVDVADAGLSLEWAGAFDKVAGKIDPSNRSDWRVQSTEADIMLAPMSLLAAMLELQNSKLPVPVAGRLSVAAPAAKDRNVDTSAVHAAGALLFDKSPKLDAMLASLSDKAKSIDGFDVQVHPRKDHRTELRWTFNLDAAKAFGKSKSVDGLSVHLDPDFATLLNSHRSRAALRIGLNVGVLGFNTYRLVRDQMKFMATSHNGLELHQRRGPGQVALRFHLGTSKPAPLILSTASVDPIQPHEDCLAKLRPILTEATSDTSTPGVYEGLTEAQKRVFETAEDCARSHPALQARVDAAKTHYLWMRAMLARRLGKHHVADRLLASGGTEPELHSQLVAQTYFPAPIPTLSFQWVDRMNQTANIGTAPKPTPGVVQLVAYRPTSSTTSVDAFRAFTHSHRHQIAWCFQNAYPNEPPTNGPMTISISVYKDANHWRAGRIFVDKKHRPLVGRCLTRVLHGEPVATHVRGKTTLHLDIVPPASGAPHKSAKAAP